VIFIDWISTKEHRSFNDSLFWALQLKGQRVYVFGDVMRVAGQDNQVLPARGGRLARAWDVLKICWHQRREPIFLLTYDAMLFPVLQLFCSRLYVYEHNTTPEGALYRKHAIWQRTLFLRVTRFAQFRMQHEILQRIGQKSVFIGSPLPEKAPLPRLTPALYIAPSDRVEISELMKLKPFIGDTEVILRKYRFTPQQLVEIKRDINITVVDYIDTERCLPLTKAFLICLAGGARGSGWFNDGIRYGIPLIITDKSVQQVFEDTFPGYPYIPLDQMTSAADLEEALDRISAFDSRNYIEMHNAGLRGAFEDAVASWI
jgi:hypothetical protein